VITTREDDSIAFSVIFIDPFEQNLSFTFFLLQLILLSNDVAENPGPDNKVGDLAVTSLSIVKYNTFFKQLTIGYNENMYTKFDHKKKKLLYNSRK
jgi:hypothetical protein